MGLFGLFKDKGIYYNLTREEMDEMIKNGDLKKIYLISPKFGGAENVSNMVYVPTLAYEQKNQIDEELENYLRQGRNVRYMCNLKYKGKSSIPSKIKIQGFIEDVGPYIKEIDVW